MHYTVQEILDTIEELNENVFNKYPSNDSFVLVFTGNENYSSIYLIGLHCEILLYQSEISEVDFNEDLNEWEPLKEFLIRTFNEFKNNLNKTNFD